MSLHIPPLMHGDPGLQLEETDIPQATEDQAAEERHKEDGSVEPLPAMVEEGSRSAPVRQEGRENEDTRTPSSCSDEKASSSVGDPRGDDALEEASRRQLSSRQKPTTISDAESPGAVPYEDAASPDAGTSPSAALIPHQSMPRLRGPRPAPTLGVKPGFGGDFQGQEARGGPGSRSSSGRHYAGAKPQKGPLGAMLNWLDDADVGDVLDRYPLPDVLPPGQPGQVSLGVPIPTSGELPQRPQLRHNYQYDDEDPDEDDLEEVPSDKEALPRAPPLAPSSVPLMRPLTPDAGHKDVFDHHRVSGYCANPTVIPGEGYNEEDEWVARQRLTGAICRLVRYSEDAITPKDDILNLRSTRRGRIMVTAVREKGIAAKAGVVAGDELVSIDGRKDFVGHPAHVVHASLRAPVTLVFLGFVGKLQAEVRVKRPPEPRLGLAVTNDILVPCEPHRQQAAHSLCDAVVFQQGENPSLLITAGASSQDTCRNNLTQERESQQAASKTLMYELHREDARNLLVNAMVTTAAL